MLGRNETRQYDIETGEGATMKREERQPKHLAIFQLAVVNVVWSASLSFPLLLFCLG